MIKNVQAANDADIDLQAAVLPEMIKDVVESRRRRRRSQESGEGPTSWSSMTTSTTATCCAAGWSATAIPSSRPTTASKRWSGPRPRRIDLILLDIIMPRVNGIEALGRLKADPRLNSIPVVMVSAFDEIDSAVRCIELGAEDYLPKPCNPVLLKARVGASLEKKRLRDRIEQERRRSDEILQSILPAQVIIDELKTTGAVKPRGFKGAAVFFCDVANFTPFCDRNTPEVVVRHLHALTETWEEIALRHQTEKIKTIGDAFMGAAGLLRRTDDHPVLHCRPRAAGR